MTHVTCRLTATNLDQLRNPTLGNRVLATFSFLVYDRIYKTVRRPSVRPSVFPVYRPLQHAACGGFAAVGPARAGDIDRLLQQATAHSSTAVSGKCEQCHVVSRRTKLTTDVLLLILSTLLVVVVVAGEYLEVSPLTKNDLDSLDFVINSFFMKLFKINYINIVKTCQSLFSFDLLSVIIENALKSSKTVYDVVCV